MSYFDSAEPTPKEAKKQITRTAFQVLGQRRGAVRICTCSRVEALNRARDAGIVLQRCLRERLENGLESIRAFPRAMLLCLPQMIFGKCTVSPLAVSSFGGERVLASPAGGGSQHLTVAPVLPPKGASRGGVRRGLAAPPDAQSAALPVRWWGHGDTDRSVLPKVTARVLSSTVGMRGPGGLVPEAAG